MVRLVALLLLLTLVAPIPVQSQDLDPIIEVEPEFFSFQDNPITRLKFTGDARGATIGEMNRYTEEKESWWMTANGKSVCIATSGGNETKVLNINSETGEVTQLGSVPSKQYAAIRGHGATIYLLRVDTTDRRFCLIAEVYSVQQSRIVATRTLTDWPRSPVKFPTRFVWDDRLQAVAVSLNVHGGAPIETRDLHVVNLQTGLRHLPVNAKDDVSSEDFSKMVPIRFDLSGHRLFLARRNNMGAKKGSLLYEFALETGTLRSIGKDTLPARVPICINHDATLAVYAHAGGYELWNIKEGKRIGAISQGSSQYSGLGRPLLRFVGKGNVLAISDGTHLRIFSGFSAIPPGQEPVLLEHQVRPTDPVSPDSDFVPVFLSSHSDALTHFGAFMTFIPDRGQHGPWMQQIKVEFPENGNQNAAKVLPLQRGKHVLLPSDEWTRWASHATYQRQFNEITSRNKYPVSVFGRLRAGKMEFRGRFFDKPEGLDFVSIHGATEQEMRQRAMRHRSGRLREVWRQTLVDKDGKMKFNVIWTIRDERPSGANKPK